MYTELFPQKSNKGFDVHAEPLFQRRTMAGLRAFSILLLVSSAAVVFAKQAAAEAADETIRNVKVGAYYYPWFEKDSGPIALDWMNRKENTWKSNVMRFRLDPPQVPMLGAHDSSDPSIVGKHIEQSLRGGIDFWAVSWWGPESKTDINFREVILPHEDSNQLQYAVLYEATGRFGEFESPSYEKWVSDLEFMREHYFNHPSYLTIDGRPVLFVYLTREYFRNRGEEALKQLRENFPEVYLVGDDVFYAVEANESYKPEWAAQFDAVTAYDIYGQSVKELGGTQAAIDFLAKNFAEAKSIANSVGTAFIPAVAPGYNDTAVRDGHPGRARYFSDKPDSKEGDIFRSMITEVALPVIDSRSDNILMVTSFNEWYEDTQIEPTAGNQPPTSRDDSATGDYFTGGQIYYDYGYLYLDILKELTK